MRIAGTTSPWPGRDGDATGAAGGGGSAKRFLGLGPDAGR
jgi:hypothetical protein